MKIFFKNKYDSFFFINYLSKNYNVAIVRKTRGFKNKKFRNNIFYSIEFVDFKKYDFVIIKSDEINNCKYNYYNKSKKLVWIVFDYKISVDYYYPSYNISKYIIKKNKNFSYYYVSNLIKQKNIKLKLIKINNFDIEFINY
jgi:hypothetical protein